MHRDADISHVLLQTYLFFLEHQCPSSLALQFLETLFLRLNFLGRLNLLPEIFNELSLLRQFDLHPHHAILNSIDALLRLVVHVLHVLQLRTTHEELAIS